MQVQPEYQMLCVAPLPSPVQEFQNKSQHGHHQNSDGRNLAEGVAY